MDVVKEIENLKRELEEVKRVQESLKIGYAQTRLNLMFCRAIALVLSGLNFLQIGIK